MRRGVVWSHAVVAAFLGAALPAFAQAPADKAGDDFTGGAPRSAVNATFLQPFVAYTTSTAVTYNVNLEASANWKAADGDEWTVPMHFTVSKLTKFGPFPMSVGGGVGIFTAAPGGRPDWRLRFVATLLLPRR